MLETPAAPAAFPAPPAPVPASPATGSTPTPVDPASIESASTESPAVESPSGDGAGEDRFLDYVPPEMVADAALPLAYRLVSPAGYGDQRVSFRAAVSTNARAKVFTPLPYHKPITRCYGGRE